MKLRNELSKFACFTLFVITQTKSRSLQSLNERIYTNTTKLIQEKTLEQIYRSKCTVVHHSVNSTFENLFQPKNEEYLEDSYIFLDELTQTCPDSTYITVSRPMQDNVYRTAKRLYVGLETRFLIRGGINVDDIIDYLGISTNASLIPRKNPQVAIQVSFSMLLASHSKNFKDYLS